MQHSSAGGGFFSKIKENYSSKLANLSISGGAYSEKDGSSADDTLIHNAFVKYYDSKGLPYPDWLGVKTFQSQQQLQQGYGNQYQQQQQDYSQSKFQPVRHNNSYNNSYSARQQQQINSNSNSNSNNKKHLVPRDQVLVISGRQVVYKIYTINHVNRQYLDKDTELLIHGTLIARDVNELLYNDNIYIYYY